MSNDQIKNLIAFLFVLLMLIMSLTSCSSNWHLKRALTKNPMLLDTITSVKTDTIYLRDIEKDTVIKYQVNVRDSIIFKDKTKLKYLIKHDTVEFQVNCPDQIIVKDSVFIDRPYIKEPSLKEVGKKYWYLPLIIMLLFIGIITYAIIKR